MAEISTITGKPKPGFEEKMAGLKAGKKIYDYLKGNLFYKGDAGADWDTPKEWSDRNDPNFTPSIYADRPAEIVYSEVGKGKAKYAGSINLKRQLISDKAKQLEAEMFAKHGVKTKVTQKQVIEEANKVVKTFNENPDYYFKRMAEIKGGGQPTYGEDLAMRMMTADDFEKFVVTSEKVMSGELPIEHLHAVQNMAKERALKMTSPRAEDAGRRLSMYNITVGQESAMNALKSLEKPLTKYQAGLLSEVNFDAPVTIQRFLASLKQPKLKDYFYEYWYNSILSGIPTHIVNVASNTMWRTFQYQHRFTTSAFDTIISVLKGRPKEVFMKEIPSMMGASLKAKPKAAKAAWEMFSKGRLSEFETKWAQEMGTTLGAFERSNSAVIRGAGKVLTIPTRGLRAMDVYANAIGYDSQMAALATRQALKKGLKGVERSNFKKAFLKNPPEWAHKDAMEYAKYTTFTNDPGAISAAIMKLRESVPGGRLIIPFVNTIGNLMKRGLEMTPGLGLALAKGQKPAEVLAKQFEGIVIALPLLLKAQRGEMVGDLPKGKAEREAFYRQGKQPWSIKIGDKYLQYRRIEPFNTVLASVSSAYEGIMEANSGAEADKVMMNVVNDIKNNLIDSSYLQGMSQILNRNGQIVQIPKNIVTSLVPYSGFWRSVNRAYEAHQEGTAKVYDNKKWLSKFGQVIPGLYKLNEPKINVWGEEIELQGGMLRQWLPYKWSKASDDIVETSLEKLGVYPGIPSDTLKINGVKTEFDEDIYTQYAVDYGREAYRSIEKIVSKGNIRLAIESGDDVKKKVVSDIIKSSLDKIREITRLRAVREQKKRIK